jgi:hypothetical protein
MTIHITEDPIVPQDKTYSLSGLSDALMYHISQAMDCYINQVDFDDEEDYEEIKVLIDVLKNRREVLKRKKKKKK